MPSKRVAIYGAGGFARELAWLANSIAEKYSVVCFIDDDSTMHGRQLNGLPVVSLETARDKYPQAVVLGGVGNPEVREKMMERAAAAGFKFETVIHPRVELSEHITLGLGTVICAGNILTVNIETGQHVQINLDCTVGHDVVMGDFTTLAPGVHVSGWVHFGKRVFVGTGAVFINGTKDSPLRIGDDAVVGAGACVTKSVLPGTTVVGIPAKPFIRG
jgi:sugar O-acyltransferase (sialic acid O-acetyltransferase NeuD family)